MPQEKTWKINIKILGGAKMFTKILEKSEICEKPCIKPEKCVFISNFFFLILRC